MSVILETTYGNITVDLFTTACPKASLNFIKLCKIKYYNFSLFHKIEENFMIQTGDPTCTGKGGESIYGILYGPQAKYFEDEIHKNIRHKKGSLSMVNTGKPNTNASQFFIATGDNLDFLDDKYTIFGQVTEGMDVVMKINTTFVDAELKPLYDIRINHTIIVFDPMEDPKGLEIPDRSPEPTLEQLETVRLVEDELEANKNKTEEEIKQEEQDKGAKAREEVLEILQDIPYAEIKPPDNVLFVCKLNPVTTEEDLELIFSRFGSIKSCEIIRDYKTRDSLCYAFIEYHEEKDCVEAFYKMNNVLIDDRRIHVDFSQSVSKTAMYNGQAIYVPKLKKLQKKYLSSSAIKHDTSNKQQFELKKDSRGQNYKMVFDNAEATSKRKNENFDDREYTKRRKYDRTDNKDRDYRPIEKDRYRDSRKDYDRDRDRRSGGDHTGYSDRPRDKKRDTGHELK